MLITIQCIVVYHDVNASSLLPCVTEFIKVWVVATISMCQVTINKQNPQCVQTYYDVYDHRSIHSIVFNTLWNFPSDSSLEIFYVYLFMSATNLLNIETYM